MPAGMYMPEELPCITVSSSITKEGTMIQINFLFIYLNMQDFPTAFYYHYQRVISIIVTSIIYIKIVGKCICIYSMIQCLMHEHTTHAQSILCFDIMYLQVCSFYYVASLLYINYIAKLRILLRINKFLYIKMEKSHIKIPVLYLFSISYRLVPNDNDVISPYFF